jgi:flavin reductase (DIM6/NTAB) family NADH-FMN oxidoreductase RutF
VSSDLRSAMRNFATGVCVATTYADRADGRRHDAVTVNSLTSVSLDPPLVSLSLRRDSGFLSDLLETKMWAVSILGGGADDVARFFARDRASRSADIDALCASPGHHTGALVLDAPSWLECVLWGSFDIGDHTLVVGEVVAAGVKRRRPALVFLHGRYHAMEDTRLGEPAHSRMPDSGEDAATNGAATAVDRAPGRRESGDHTGPPPMTAPVCDSPSAL